MGGVLGFHFKVRDATKNGPYLELQGLSAFLVTTRNNRNNRRSDSGYGRPWKLGHGQRWKCEYGRRCHSERGRRWNLEYGRRWDMADAGTKTMLGYGRRWDFTDAGIWLMPRI